VAPARLVGRVSVLAQHDDNRQAMGQVIEMHAFDETTDWMTPRREPVRNTLTKVSNSSDQSAGFRLGVSRNYAYGQSRPELRPLVTD
jgi:hypothetical protein